MSEPVHIAAIDAGSNAVRLSVARAYSALDIEPLYNERYSLRLGEGVFVQHRFSEKTFKKGVKAFCHFKEAMDEFGVTKYRAVATSASREARNRDAFIRRIKQKAGLRLDVISAGEESRLGREAVLASLGPEVPPRCIIDLGGGSMEVTILRDRAVEYGAHLPVGTVRLMCVHCWNRNCPRVRTWANKWPWRSVATRKLWLPSPQDRASMACPCCNFLCCATGCPIFCAAMCDNA
jgi:exopolyphosphatase/pppGpp-phosphohydrolase